MRLRATSAISTYVSFVLFCSGCRHCVERHAPFCLAPPRAVTISCAAEPATVFPGEPITLTASAGNVAHKNHLIYTWSGQGVTGTDSTAKVDTVNLAPGSYTVNCGVREGKPGKEGRKAQERASGAATFLVKEMEPPRLSCSAIPGNHKPGDSATVTAQGVSPQNRPLTYSYQVSAGTISGGGTNATYSSIGAPTGPVQIICSATDDKGHTATASTSIAIEAPPPPPGPSPEQVRLEARLVLHSIFFAPNQPTALHPEQGLAGSQQQALITLATDFKSYLKVRPDAQLSLTGHAHDCGSPACNLALSRRRADLAKDFLVMQGVPELAISVQALGQMQELTSEQVKILIKTNPALNDKDREKYLDQLTMMQQAENRRVDATLVRTGQQTSEQYPFNAPDVGILLGINIAGVQASSSSSATPSRSAAPGCRAFALLGYPVGFDLGQKDQLAQSFRLIAGNFDPQRGIAASGVTDLICEAAGMNPGCVPPATWEQLARGCDTRPAWDLKAVKNSYEFKIWPILDALPASVCENHQFPGNWLDVDGKDQAQCQPSFNGIFSWRWFAKIKDHSFDGRGDSSVEVFLTSSANAGIALSGKYTVDLKPVPQTRVGEAQSWVEKQIQENLWKWICAIAAALFTAIAPRFRWLAPFLKKKPEATAEAAPKPPTVIVVAPQSQSEAQMNQPNPNLEPRRRPGHRRPHV